MPFVPTVMALITEYGIIKQSINNSYGTESQSKTLEVKIRIKDPYHNLKYVMVDHIILQNFMILDVYN